MKSLVSRHMLRAAVGSILVGIVSQATLSFAADDPSTENEQFTRAGGPRVELRVAGPVKNSAQTVVRMPRFGRG